ncbi:hypothetical protein RND71_042583 [Anisodus tanguticus]|uniref:Pectin acetylesterase n=1 Tax=Anisodus tanguticus TaxID=243964 RepID=A0AAE1USE8_9SOLA|nr:hypothetical protein RND71_042583 [Anisodus tanguticus]
MKISRSSATCSSSNITGVRRIMNLVGVLFEAMEEKVEDITKTPLEAEEFGTQFQNMITEVCGDCNFGGTMAMSVKHMSIIIATLDVLSFIFGVVAENNKGEEGHSLQPEPQFQEKGLLFVNIDMIQLLPWDFCLLFLAASAVAGFLSLFYPYKGKSIPQAVLQRSTSFIIFLNVALGQLLVDIFELMLCPLTWTCKKFQWMHRVETYNFNDIYNVGNKVMDGNSGSVKMGLSSLPDSKLLKAFKQLADNTRKDYFEETADLKGEPAVNYEPDRTAAFQPFILALLACLELLCTTVLSAADDLYVNITILQSATVQGAEFYNWNRVRVKYCDGSFFTGDVEQVDAENNLFFRGARIFKAIMEDLWSKGMRNAENAILCGTSAGGLATILNCDKLKSLLPNDARVKCVADAGFFINGKTIFGTPDIQEMYRRIVNLHGQAKNLPSACTSAMEPSLCFFPQSVIPYVQTPLFIINSIYDTWQVKETKANFP